MKPDQTPATDALLLPYVEAFEAQYGIDVVTPLYFSDLDNSVVGVCRVWSNGKTEIMIDRAYFDEYQDDHYAIEELIYHELGHCVFRRHHDTTILGSGIPKSIMYPYVFGDTNLYKNNRAYYIGELSTVTNNFAFELKAPNKPDYVDFID